MDDAARNKYLLEGLTLGEWWDIMGAEEIAKRERGISCTVDLAWDHRLRDHDLDTPNFVCCPSQGLDEVRFVHSLLQASFSVKKSSPVRLEGHLEVEGHKIVLRSLPAVP